MSSLFSSLFSFFSYSDELTDELQQPYNASLLHIVHNLETDQLKELYFYFTGRISEQTTGYLHILRSLENDGKFSWLDLRSLKEALSVIHRRDLAKSLTKFEIKRDLVILLDFYARMRRGSESRSRSSSVELVAGYLVNLMSEIARDGFDVTNVRSLTETDSRKGITEVLIAFEAEINREMSDPWRRLICLVVIAGEMVGEVLENKELHCRETKVPKLCSMAADMLSTRVIKLGGWETFCDYVKERYNQVYCQENEKSDASGLTVKRKIADAVQQLKRTAFFQDAVPQIPINKHHLQNAN